MKTQEIKFKHKKQLFFMVRVVKWQNRLPTEVVDAPSLEIIKTQLDMSFRTLL